MSSSAKDRKQAKKIILECIEKSNSITTACKVARISRETFYEWIKSDGSFAAEVDAADGRAEAELVETVSGAGPMHWGAAAWILERRWAGTWGRKEEVDHSGGITIKIVRDRAELSDSP
jgi:hypothetical protein